MTWPAASLLARGSLYAAVALMGAYLLFVLVPLAVAMRRGRAGANGTGALGAGVPPLAPGARGAGRPA